MTTTSSSPKCEACSRMPIKCNRCRRADHSARATANRQAIAEYLTSGPLTAERIAHHDAAARR